MRETLVNGICVLVLSFVVVLCGCAGRSHTNRVIPPDSAFAKVAAGMRGEEVVRLLGKPTDEHKYVTGKAFIPFYFGTEDLHMAWYYKGQGRIILTGGSAFGYGAGEVIRVEYDVTEDGYFD